MVRILGTIQANVHAGSLVFRFGSKSPHYADILKSKVGYQKTF
jgi:hypothetical protein